MARRVWHLPALLCLVGGARADDFWDNFANNLATDLAPLIQLFGEAVTKQYLSESLDIWDNIIFACAPLGILTAVVSAIRVCGSPSLKAFIGRAQESTGVAELELLSSTSKSTAELWHEGGITRVFGEPQISEFVYAGGESGRKLDSKTDKSNPDVSSGIGVQRLDDVLTELRAASLDRKRPTPQWSPATYVRPRFATIPSETDLKPISDDDDVYRLYGWRYVGSSEQPQQEKLSYDASPNLSLNLGIKRLSRGYFYAAALFGLALQLAVLAFAAITLFVNPGLFPVKTTVNYGFPCLIIGTVLLCFGMLACAYIIEAATLEDYFVNDGQSPVWLLQMGGQKVGDQVFRAFAARHVSNVYIRSTQKMRGRPEEIRLWVAVVVTVLGFVVQFVALRALHASVTLFQLGSTLVMSVIRASLRSSRLKPTTYLLQSEGEEFHELDQITHKLVAGDKNWCILLQPSSKIRPNPTNSEANSETAVTPFASKEIPKNGDVCIDTHDAFVSKITELVKVRARLGWLHEAKYGKSSQPLSAKFAERLQRAIEDTADALMPYVEDDDSSDEEEFSFPIKISAPWSSQQSFEWEFILRGDTGSWKLRDPADLGALLGLFSWTGEEQGLRRNTRIVVDESTITRGLDHDAYQAWIQRRMEPMLAENLTQIHRPEQGAEHTWGHIPVNLVAVHLDQSPTLTSAQNLYGLFVEEVLRCIPELPGQLTLRGTALYIRNQSILKLQHSKVEKLAGIFEETQLGTREDAYMVIVPAMFRQSKIPNLNEAYHVVLKQAIRRNDADTMKQLVGAGYLNQPLDSTGRTALLVASSHTNAQIVKALIDAGANVNASNDRGWTPLHLVAKYGLVRSLKYLIAGGANIDALTNSGKTPLYVAALYEEPKIVRYLVGKRADTNIQSSDGSTVLHAAALSASKEMIQLLLKNGADDTITDTHEWTAAYVAWACLKSSARKLFPKFRISEKPHGVAPSGWSSESAQSPNFKLSDDGLTATSDYDSENAVEGYPMQLQANHPIPAGKYIFYYEVKVVALSAGDEISIGITARDEPEDSPLLGRNKYGWAYHSRVGYKFHKAKHGFEYGTPFGEGDIIGCGVDLNTWTCFFTKNGKALPTAFRGMKGRLWPCVGVKGDSLTTFKANFSGPFLWNVENYKGPTGKVKAIRGETVDAEDSTDNESNNSEADDDEDSGSADSDDSDIVNDTDQDTDSRISDESDDDDDSSLDDSSDDDDDDDDDDSDDDDDDDDDDVEADEDNDNNDSKDANDTDDKNKTSKSKSKEQSAAGPDAPEEDQSWSTLAESESATSKNSNTREKADSAKSTGKQSKDENGSTSRKRIVKH